MNDPQRQDLSQLNHLDRLDRSGSMEDFELLSAYLDGEVSPEQRKQVQQWLARDDRARELYLRLSKLRQTFRSFPTPEPQVSAAELADRVFASENSRCGKRVALLGGAVAAAVVATLTSLALGDRPLPKFASGLNLGKQEHSLQQEDPPEELLLAIDRPLFEIPDAALTPTQGTNSHRDSP